MHNFTCMQHDTCDSTSRSNNASKIRTYWSRYFSVTQVTIVHLVTMLLYSEAIECTNHHILFLYSLHWFLAAGNLICAIYTIIFIKLWSYAQVNYWCRIALKSKAAGGATYDGNRQFNRNNSLIELSQNPPARKHN